MITTVGSASIYHLIQIQEKEKGKKEKRKTNFLLVMRTLRTYSLNNF